MRKVIEGCEVCGKQMLTDGNPLVKRTCDACKAKQVRESSRRLAARRKARRHAFKAGMEAPRDGANRLTLVQQHWQWSRKFCGDTYRQAAFRCRNS